MAGSAQIVVDTATPLLRRLALGVTTAQLGPVAGRAVVNLVRGHLVNRNASHPNSIGGRRTNFWSAAARSTHMQPAPYGALVSINQLGFRLQYQGGTVRPKAGKRYLTIPAVPEAYGMLAGEFPDLVFGYARDPRSGRQRPALLRAAQTQIRIAKKKDGSRSVKPVATELGTQAVYWLVRKATIPAHPDALPTAQEMGVAARDTLNAYLDRIAARRTAPGN